MTFTEVTFKPSQIKTTGSFLSTSQYIDGVSIDYIKTYLQTYLIINPLEDVIDKLYKQNPGYGLGLHAGEMTRNIDTLLDNITSAIAVNSVDMFEDPIMAMAFNAAQIEMCSAKDLNIIIENAILNLATHDHFNEFENK
jgi:hypothetical protein